MNAMMPPSQKRCHKTGFQETCLKCVTEYGCDLWRPLRLESDRASGQAVTEVYGCIDLLMDIYLKNVLGRLDTIAANVDKLSKEVRDSNDAGLASSLMGINSQIRRIADASAAAEIAQIAAAPSPKMLAGDS